MDNQISKLAMELATLLYNEHGFHILTIIFFWYIFYLISHQNKLEFQKLSINQDKIMGELKSARYEKKLQSDPMNLKIGQMADQPNFKNDELMELIRSNIQANQATFTELKNSQITLTQSFESLKGEVDQIKFKMNSVGTPSTTIA